MITLPHCPSSFLSFSKPSVSPRRTEQTGSCRTLHRYLVGQGVLYKSLCKYASLLAMLTLLAASLLNMCLKRPQYTAWNRQTVSEMPLVYPDWALAVLSSLIIIAVLPVPVGYVHFLVRQCFSQSALYTEAGQPRSIMDTDSVALSAPLNTDFNSVSPLVKESFKTGEKQGEKSTRV